MVPPGAPALPVVWVVPGWQCPASESRLLLIVVHREYRIGMIKIFRLKEGVCRQRTAEVHPLCRGLNHVEVTFESQHQFVDAVITLKPIVEAQGNSFILLLHPVEQMRCVLSSGDLK